MATSSNWNPPYDELTLCPICFERFKCPKTLPCLHNFCQSCIGSYLSSFFEKEHDNVKYVNCPICRTKVQKPEKVNTSEEWTKSLPTNHMLVSMLDAVTGFPEANICHLCNIESKTESAVFWCVDCRKSLCQPCERKHAFLIQGHKVVSVKQMNELEPKTLGVIVKCSKHEEKVIEAYCFDHRVPCCSSCVMITHRKCSRVEEATNAAEELRNSNLILGLQEDFENHKKRMEEISDKTAENVKSLKGKVADIENEISTLRSDINRHLDDLELKAKQELTALEKEHVPEMEAMVEMMSGETKRADNDLMILSASVQYASDEQFLCDIEKLTNEKNKMNKIWEENQTNVKKKQLIFELNDELRNIKKVKNFMKVSLKGEKMLLESDPTDLLQAEPVQVSTFDIDSRCTNITGCTMVDANRLLLATYSRNRVDMYGIDGTHLSSLDLRSQVWGVGIIDEYNAAATLRTARKVVFLSVADKSLALKHSLDCSYGADIYGIQSCKNKLYIGSVDKIIVLDKNGSFIEAIEQPARGYWIRHLSVSDENLIYTNGNQVNCIKLHGDNVFQFSSPELCYPEGISTDSDNNIYVIGHSSRNIFQLSPHGKIHQILLKNLPQGNINSLFFCKRSNRLIFNTGKTVHVYEMRKSQSQAP